MGVMPARCPAEGSALRSTAGFALLQRMWLRTTQMRRLIVFFFLGLILAGPASARLITNVDYGPQRLDIHTPAAGNAPVIVYVHGGAWTMGSKSGKRAMARYFNRLGYVFVSVGYDKYPGASIDTQERQVATAINWTVKNARTFGGDPGRVAVMGFSAGAHLASLAVLSGGTPAVRALVAVDTGAYDVAYLASLNGNRLGPLYAAPFSNRARWSDWSPINRIGRSRRIPVMVIWSNGRNRDRITARFADRLQGAGHPVARLDGSRFGHISLGGAIGRDKATSKAIANFLASTLG